jgi:hypothetical protein
MEGYNPYPVIPAKAGIQIYTPQSWIPAAVYPGGSRDRNDNGKHNAPIYKKTGKLLINTILTLNGGRGYDGLLHQWVSGPMMRHFSSMPAHEE